MFGLNSQAVAQDNGAIDNYSQELPVGGDDLLSSGPLQTNDQSQQQYQENVLNFNPAQSDQQTVQPAQATQPDQQQQYDQTNVTGNDDLINIKKDALQQLTPLVGHLDQTPDEKFRTTMMLIQATDDKSLLRSAYESALQIPDEKSRAQALLDVVNEINYFTHPDVQ